MISGGGTNLQAIIDGCADGRIDATVVFTGSDTPDVKGLDRAKKAGIDTFVVDYRKIIKKCRESPEEIKSSLPSDFDLVTVREKQSLMSDDHNPSQVDFFLQSRAVAEKMLLEKIEHYGIDLLVLAGFMRTLTPYFIDRINVDPNNKRIMNIHPALLPAFPGTDGYGDTFRYGCKVGGCTVHFIDYGEDTGPIIGQRAFQIEDGDTLDDVKKKGLALEWELYPACIQKFADNLLV
ncbi:Phosphoribosylglycinamide formyltransferase [Desulfamplus magnetovallimortis]|uniref:Phosphoribosylglycinamide formyltransferase n=1 Tax=Desulfamplus magnetovallimortis TaxID=1246637 RepID=A0A1W1HE28_9BACT|nr:phosphoribosylglycinamide formyltransferase [Desulfamplus magnetovallimortis]SLM30747.1 Phosphoribosylglycinamide formyltransferase [Desulfamplus magnetovallimortis]